MAYATSTDCLLFAPQAASVSGVDWDGYIAQADAVIDSRLRASFEVPLDAPIPQLIVTISAGYAAGRYLEAAYSAINQEPPAYAAKLIDDALKALQEIVEDPSIVDIERRDITLDDLNENSIRVADRDPGLFHSMDPEKWGREWE